MAAENSHYKMTKEEKKEIVMQYMRGVDQGLDISHLFAEHAEVCFPKWGIAAGRDEIMQMFTDIGTILGSLKHDYAHFNYYSDEDTMIVEGTSSGTTKDGVQFTGGLTYAGFFTDVFEIRDFKIQRLYVYLDPDYWGKNTAPYPWLTRDEEWPKH